MGEKKDVAELNSWLGKKQQQSLSEWHDSFEKLSFIAIVTQLELATSALKAGSLWLLDPILLPQLADGVTIAMTKPEDLSGKQMADSGTQDTSQLAI